MADETKEYEPDELAPGSKAGPPLIKQCSICKKTKEASCFYKDSSKKDGLKGQCKECTSEYDKKRRAKRKKNRLEETDLPEGHKRCSKPSCNRVLPLSHFQSNVRGQTEPTARCDICRAIKKKTTENPTTASGKCNAFYRELQQTNSCVKCEEEGEACVYPRDWRLIEFDHIDPKAKRKKRTGEEGHELSDSSWWANHGGVEAMKEEVKKCQALCIFHHRTKSKNETGEETQPSRIQKREIINEKKRERGGCLVCGRECIEGNEYLFNLRLREGETSTICVSRLVCKSWDYFDENLDDELAKRDMLCCGCNKLQ
jgi:hypothetical protein